VGPIADSVAQFGPFADVIDSGRLLSPIVSITPSDAVVINPEATEMGSGDHLAPAAVADVVLSHASLEPRPSFSSQDSTYPSR
jgi:hypothetical protein